jgi:hypothetical protein
VAEPGAPVVSAEEPIDRDRTSVAFYLIGRVSVNDPEPVNDQAAEVAVLWEYVRCVSVITYIMRLIYNISSYQF